MTSPILFSDKNIVGISISVELCGMVLQQSLAMWLNQAFFTAML